ncbi:hypothetical protein NYO99_11825 [Pelomonas sp. UHG3]|uniref:Uncharacterized protein n=1 Tax=Roseateles hydrophilus TaxID=2975054 RepID=A0ACC6CB58_9BURK|nr:hypothetical protein [Pelomonas sp. UHG3]MCY4745663.1 hypothetical protein [Pelomonas sp. UHG3]
MKRRALIFSGAAMVLAPLPALAIAPAVLAIYLSLISAGGLVLSAKVAADRNAESNRETANIQMAIERMRQEFQFRILSYQVGSHGVRQEAAFNRDVPARQGWTDDVDDQGTYMGLSNGLIAAERGKFSGTISTAEVSKFTEKTRHGLIMPVPVEDGYHDYSARDADRVAAMLRPTMGEDSRVIAGRRYSVASKPTTAGWDLETVLYADGKNDVKAATLMRSKLYG